MNKASLKISLSPRDLRLLYHVLPHQINYWNDSIDEILLVLDLHGYNLKEDQENIQKIYNLVETLSSTFQKIRMIEVDYSLESEKLISNAYFGGKHIPAKTHRYGPYFSYFFGIYHTKNDFVLNIDSDIFFGGYNPEWIEQAIELIQNKKNIITCSPHPGPPREDGKLRRQVGETDKSELKKIIFNSMSSRVFFINKLDFQERICPIPIKLAKWPLLIRAILRGKPIYELPEDTISDLMRRKKLKRVDFLGSSNGVWTLHPPYRNEEFYAKLPSIIRMIENDNIPLEQRGDYDLNDSMVDWEDARELIKNASIKKKLFNLFQ